MTDAHAEAEASPEPAPRPVPAWVGPLIGIAAAALGLLPWLVTGLRLPLQNLWAESTAPHDMPLALLPISQYSLSLIFGLIVIGSAAAGIAARALRPRLRRGGFALLLCATPLAQAAVIAQATLVVRAGLQERTESTLYLAAIVGVSAVSLLVGVLAQTLVASAPRAGALIGLTVAAIAAPPWLGGFLQPFLLFGPDGLHAVMGLLPWATPVLTGIAIAWTGVATVGRVLAALLSLALIWIAPAVMTGIGSAAGTRVLARDLDGLIAYALQVFTSALFIPELALRPIIVAVVVAAIGLGVRWMLRPAGPLLNPSRGTPRR